MSLTLAEARTVVQHHLDDDGTRWSATTAGEIDLALRSSISSCMEKYVRKGGRRFCEEVTGTTSASTGILDLSSYDPIWVGNVSMVNGTRRYPLRAVAKQHQDTPDLVARSLEMYLVRKPVLPTTTSHPLIGNGATSYGSWDDFDNWVCARAAQWLLIKDNEVRDPLERLEARLADSVLDSVNLPSAVSFPGRASWYSKWLSWSWNDRDQELLLTRSL